MVTISQAPEWQDLTDPRVQADTRSIGRPPCLRKSGNAPGEPNSGESLKWRIHVSILGQARSKNLTHQQDSPVQNHYIERRDCITHRATEFYGADLWKRASMRESLAELNRRAPVGLSGSVLLTAFEQAPNAAGVCDEDGKFLAVNAALCRLAGSTRDDMIGRPFLRYIHPDDRSASLATYFQSVVAAAAGMPVAPEECQLRCVNSSGQTIWITARWTVSEPDDAGAQFAVVHLCSLQMAQ